MDPQTNSRPAGQSWLGLEGAEGRGQDTGGRIFGGLWMDGFLIPAHLCDGPAREEVATLRNCILDPTAPEISLMPCALGAEGSKGTWEAILWPETELFPIGCPPHRDWKGPGLRHSSQHLGSRKRANNLHKQVLCGLPLKEVG